jgi:hypothetical protein
MDIGNGLRRVCAGPIRDAAALRTQRCRGGTDGTGDIGFPPMDLGGLRIEKNRRALKPRRGFLLGFQSIPWDCAYLCDFVMLSRRRRRGGCRCSMHEGFQLL